MEHGFYFHLEFPVSGVVVKGNPFWMGLDGDMKPIFLCVDVKNEQIRVFSGPNYVDNETTYTSIMALEDKAAQIVYYSLGAELNVLIDVYVLEESSGVWSLMYSIEPMGLQMRTLFYCYRNGKFVMKGRHCRLLTYDTECAEINDLGIAEGVIVNALNHRTINHIESLVSIEGMERVSEEAAREVGQETAIDRNASDAMMMERIE